MSPPNVVNLYPPPRDARSSVLPVPEPIQTQVASPYDLHQPIHPSPLRHISNVTDQPPPELQRRLTIANLGTPGGKMVGFPRTRQRNLSAPKKVRFKGADIIIPPLPTLSTSPTPPTENVPTEARKPLDLSGENRHLTSSDHARIYPVGHETFSVDEFPDSPSVYSLTPPIPNSSGLPKSYLSDSSKGSPKLAEVYLAVIDISHHNPFPEQFSGEGPSTEQPAGEQPRGEDRSTVSRDATKLEEHAPDRRRDNSADGLSWWSRVTIALSAAKVWEKKAHAAAAKEPRGKNRTSDHRQEESTGQS